MAITSEHMTGFVVGVGFTAFGFYVYKKNQQQVDDFLRNNGIEISHEREFDSLSLEQLVAEKERLEDLIAEREISQDTSENS